MNAVVSGRSGRALIIDGTSLKSFDLDDPSTIVPRNPADLQFLFGEARDLRVIENTTIEYVERELKADSNFTLALDLTLISLDAELDTELRREALAELEELLSDTATIEKLENVLYSSPLPEDAHLTTALELCDEKGTGLVLDFFKRLEVNQLSITQVDLAWTAIPSQNFNAHENREVFRRVAVKEGLFRALVTSESGSISTFLLKAGLNRSVLKLPNYRQVLQAWIAPFRDARPIIRIVKEDDDEDISPEERRFGKRDRIDRHAVLKEARRRKSVIIAAMHRRDFHRVNELVDGLVAYQQSNGESQHIAKSLCDLAMEAKELGILSLQLELTERSISVAPGDGWSWAQHADALLGINHTDEALKAYEQAEAFGAGRVAKNGRAEVLKAQGQLDAALSAYQEIIRQHPEDVVAKNGRAEVLKAQGQLDAALSAYQEIIRQHPENVVAKTGRAEVLKARGQLDAALSAYQEIIRQHPEDVVAKNGRAEVLKAQGQLDAALSAYQEIIRQHPEDVVAKNGRAEVLKAQGQLDAALSVYEELVHQHPEDAIIRNSRICVLVELRRYHDALECLPKQSLVTIDDWVAYHIKGMILLRLGDVQNAIKIFSDGMQNSPFAATKEYFRGALGLCWLRGKDFKKAGETLDEITSPIVQPSANVIRIHVFGAQGERQRALQAYNNLTSMPHLLQDELTQELHHQYVLGEKSTKDDEWIFDREVRIFLRAA